MRRGRLPDGRLRRVQQLPRHAQVRRPGHEAPVVPAAAVPRDGRPPSPAAQRFPSVGAASQAARAVAPKHDQRLLRLPVPAGGRRRGQRIQLELPGALKFVVELDADCVEGQVFEAIVPDWGALTRGPQQGNSPGPPLGLRCFLHLLVLLILLILLHLLILLLRCRRRCRRSSQQSNRRFPARRPTQCMARSHTSVQTPPASPLAPCGDSCCSFGFGRGAEGRGHDATMHEAEGISLTPQHRTQSRRRWRRRRRMRRCGRRGLERRRRWRRRRRWTGRTISP